MPRLNISVPDDLYKRLDEVRDSLNVSAVCQEALRREISRREPMPSDVDVTEETIERLLPEADCYVQPSVVTPSGKMEGIPVSIMEALACEVPVVASAISGIPELVEHGVTGSLVPPADSRALALALLDVVRDPERFRRRARAGRLRVLKEYRLERNVAEIARLFSTFGGPDRGSRPSLRPAS